MHFVFLQGMPSPFFSRIADALRVRGCQTSTIHLCAGDWILWKGKGRVHFRGRYVQWPQFFADYCTKHQVTDLVLLGEQRRYHKEAVQVAHRLNIRVTVTDFGYLRPDWITLERDGMSGNSRFPRDAETIKALAAAAPLPPAHEPFADKFWTMAWGDMVYSFANVLLWWLYPFYRRSDNRLHPVLYFPAIGLRLLLSARRNARAQATLNMLHETKKRFFLFPLQLEHDFQIVAYSPFSDMEEPIDVVLGSFARNAPDDTYLLCKVHPWDPGLKHWRTRIAEQALKRGIAHRVYCIDGSTIDHSLQGASGMVTVNSTSGLRALELGYPVKTLGQAIYDINGLTHQNTLDSFWTSPTPPDAELMRSFMQALTTIQIRGVFFNEPGLTAAVEAATDKLCSMA